MYTMYKKAEKKTFVTFGPAIEHRRGKFGESTILSLARNFYPFVNFSSFHFENIYFYLKMVRSYVNQKKKYQYINHLFQFIHNLILGSRIFAFFPSNARHLYIKQSLKRKTNTHKSLEYPTDGSICNVHLRSKAHRHTKLRLHQKKEWNKLIIRLRCSFVADD